MVCCIRPQEHEEPRAKVWEFAEAEIKPGRRHHRRHQEIKAAAGPAPRRTGCFATAFDIISKRKIEKKKFYPGATAAAKNLSGYI